MNRPQTNNNQQTQGGFINRLVGSIGLMHPIWNYSIKSILRCVKNDWQFKCKNEINTGDVVISAVIRACAINKVEIVKDTETESYIFVWSANAAEQIESALYEMGYKLTTNVRDKQ
jgi:hypothetical protein